ncbi:MAG: hypothetical protein ABIH23_04290 [bacterium]
MCYYHSVQYIIFDIVGIVFTTHGTAVLKRSTISKELRRPNVIPKQPKIHQADTLPQQWGIGLVMNKNHASGEE